MNLTPNKTDIGVAKLTLTPGDVLELLLADGTRLVLEQFKTYAALTDMKTCDRQYYGSPPHRDPELYDEFSPAVILDQEPHLNDLGRLE